MMLREVRGATARSADGTTPQAWTYLGRVRAREVAPRRDPGASHAGAHVCIHSHSHPCVHSCTHSVKQGCTLGPEHRLGDRRGPPGWPELGPLGARAVCAQEVERGLRGVGGKGVRRSLASVEVEASSRRPRGQVQTVGRVERGQGRSLGAALRACGRRERRGSQGQRKGL